MNRIYRSDRVELPYNYLIPDTIVLMLTNSDNVLPQYVSLDEDWHLLNQVITILDETRELSYDHDIAKVHPNELSKLLETTLSELETFDQKSSKMLDSVIRAVRTLYEISAGTLSDFDDQFFDSEDYDDELDTAEIEHLMCRSISHLNIESTLFKIDSNLNITEYNN